MKYGLLALNIIMTGVNINQGLYGWAAITALTAISLMFSYFAKY